MMSGYYYRRNRRYNTQRRYIRKNRKTKIFDRLEIIIIATIILYVIMRMSGASNALYVQTISVILLYAAIIYAFYKLLKSIFRNIKFTGRLRSLRDNRDIDAMSGIEFEHFVAKLLKSRGCNSVSLTDYYDLGVDIIAKKDGITWGIQTKRYKNLVTAEAVRQVVTALKSYGCTSAMVITSSPVGYSKPAKELAASNGCVLVDRRTLLKWVKDYDQGKSRPLTINQGTV